MRWTDAPLTQSDYARIRANVLSQTRSSARLWRASLALATTIAAIALLIPKRPALPTTPPRNAGVHAGRSAGFQPALPSLAAAEPELGGPAVRRTAVPRKPRKREPQQPMRIELQTTDPDIRIIWITSTEES